MTEPAKLDAKKGAGPGKRRARPAAGTMLAAIDLGTNNCRLLIAETAADGAGFKVVDSFARIVRLGEGLISRGELSAQPMARAIEALGVCARKMEHWNVRRRWAVTTEACRRARNGKAFIAEVRKKTGIALDIIAPEREVRLAVKGCAPLFDPAYESILLFDIGGGSTELAWLVRDGAGAFRVAAWATLALGVVTLADSFGGREVSAASYDAMVAFVAAQLAAIALPGAVGAQFARGRSHHLGTSGTVTTLAGVHLDLGRYERAKIDGLWLSRADLARAGARLRAMSYDQRAAHACIGPERADLVIAGYAILDAIHRAWPSEVLRVADRGLREGMLLTLLKGPGRWRRRRAKRGGARAGAPVAKSSSP